MTTPIEERLTALYENAKDGFEMPREVHRRLQFLARVLQHESAVTGAEVFLLWFDARGEVASVPVGCTGIVIGREPDCDVMIANPCVSRRHCALRRIAGDRQALELEDLGSSNGTKVNGRLLPEHGKKLLQDGDVLEVGGINLAVQVSA